MSHSLPDPDPQDPSQSELYPTSKLKNFAKIYVLNTDDDFVSEALVPGAVGLLPPGAVVGRDGDVAGQGVGHEEGAEEGERANHVCGRFSNRTER